MINLNFVLNMRLMYNLENKGRGGGPNTFSWEIPRIGLFTSQMVHFPIKKAL